MNSPVNPQTTLVTAHKGVDLHAASALLVMRERLEGGDRLEQLFRCEIHLLGGAGRPVPDAGDARAWDGPRLLATGRFFNPNKHHYGLFSAAGAAAGLLQGEPAGGRLPGDWLGSVVETDLTGAAAGSLYDTLLGGTARPGSEACDVLSLARGQDGPVRSGVLWRLVVRGDRAEARAVGEKLAVARHRKQGLLVNPHMEYWYLIAREGQAE